MVDELFFLVKKARNLCEDDDGWVCIEAVKRVCVRERQREGARESSESLCMYYEMTNAYFFFYLYLKRHSILRRQVCI